LLPCRRRSASSFPDVPRPFPCVVRGEVVATHRPTSFVVCSMNRDQTARNLPPALPGSSRGAERGTGAMKQTQWAVALCALAALVFGITFAMNYLGGPPSSSPGPNPDGNEGEPLELTFPTRMAPVPLKMIEGAEIPPEEALRVLECEEKKSSYQDF